MATPPYHILKEMANGVLDQKGKFFPFVFAKADVAAKPGIRYYVSKAWITASQDAATAAAIDKIEVTIRKETVIIAEVNSPQTFAASNDAITCEFDCGALTDTGSAINITIASKAGLALVRYAEIDEVDGEYVQ